MTWVGSAPARTAGRSTFAALKTRNYCLYWVGLVFYVLGHRAEYMTFAWIMWEITQDPLFLGYLGLAQGAPLVVFQLFGGVLADRTNRLRLLIGTLTVATMAHRILRPGTTLLVMAAGMGLGLVTFSMSPGMWLALPVLLLVGFTNTFYLTPVSTILQQRVPDQLRGRVMSIYSLCWNLLPLGGLLSGVLAAAVDARFAVLVGGALVAANALLLLMSRRLRAIS